MSWGHAAILAQIVLLIYFLATEWLDLFPWNDVFRASARHHLVGTAVNGLPIFVLACAFIWQAHSLMGVGVVFYALWLATQLRIWWWPYLFGASDQQREEYEKLFGRTWKFLPPIGNHPIPDAQHLVLQGFRSSSCSRSLSPISNEVERTCR